MINDYDDPSFKFVTKNRDLYQIIRDNDASKLFSSIADTFTVAFAIGFHLNGCKDPRDGNGKAINHANMVSIKSDVREIIAILVCDRHPEIDNKSDLWHKVEQYAEFGIERLYESLKENEWQININDILGIDSKNDTIL